MSFTVIGDMEQIEALFDVEQPPHLLQLIQQTQEHFFVEKRSHSPPAHILHRVEFLPLTIPVNLVQIDGNRVIYQHFFDHLEFTDYSFYLIFVAAGEDVLVDFFVTCSHFFLIRLLLPIRLIKEPLILINFLRLTVYQVDEAFFYI